MKCHLLLYAPAYVWIEIIFGGLLVSFNCTSSSLTGSNELMNFLWQLTNYAAVSPRQERLIPTMLAFRQAMEIFLSEQSLDSFIYVAGDLNIAPFDLKT